MRRLLLLLAGCLVLLPAAPAAAGGGCHSGGFADEAATTVVLKGNCFAPTVLRVQPGAVVQFVNDDSYEHFVHGAVGLWGGKGPLAAGDELSVAFERAGTFPYSCYLHPTMTGAVVVGDGVYDASKPSGVTTAPTKPHAEVQASQSASAESSPALAGWGLLGGVVVAAVAGLAAVGFRRRRPTPA